MPEETRYALWLVPERDIYEELAALIKKLSKSHGSPVFEPHVTLLGGITSDNEEDVLKRTHILASRVEPFEIKLKEVWFRQEYYLCLFLKAEPTDGLIGANIDAKLAMAEVCKPPEFYPHLSLLYGEFFPMVKEAIIEDIGSEMEISFKAESVKLVRTSGGPKEWKAIGQFRFQ